MNSQDFAGLLRRKTATIITITFLTVVAVLGFSLLGSLKYSAKSKLLVVQNSVGLDSYAVSRSNEYLGRLFSQVTYSGSFYNLVLNSQYKVDRNYFNGSYGEQINLWRKTVSTRTLADTGIVEIEVYHPNPEQARIIALAVNDVLINQNANFQGGGEGVNVSVLDQPLVSDYPDHPNLLYNFFFSLAAGLAFSFVFIYLFPERRYDLRLLPRIKRKEKTKLGNIKIEREIFEPKGISETKEDFEPKGDMGAMFR
jgi:capsular polysaccharide biosynthesis protein